MLRGLSIVALMLGGCARGAKVPPSLVEDPCVGADAYETPPGAIDTVRIQTDVREAFGEVRFLAMCVDGGAALRADAASLNQNRGGASRLLAVRGSRDVTAVILVETAASQTRASQSFVARSTKTVDFDSAALVTAVLVDDDPGGPAFRPRIDWHVRDRR